jgi:predicted small lipoprotein YifL
MIYRTDGPMPASRLITVLVVAAAVGLVAGCGRKGGLDTPYQAAVDARKEASRNKEPLPPEPTVPEPDKKFILDGLLD